MAIFEALRPAGCFADALSPFSFGADMIHRIAMDAWSRV
jgi:hypothetical protein